MVEAEDMIAEELRVGARGSRELGGNVSAVV